MNTFAFGMLTCRGGRASERECYIAINLGISATTFIMLFMTVSGLEEVGRSACLAWFAFANPSSSYLIIITPPFPSCLTLSLKSLLVCEKLQCEGGLCNITT